MYFNLNGKTQIVKQSVIEDYLLKKRTGNIIYCLQENDNYFATEIEYTDSDEINLAVAKYMLKGYIVHYHVDKRTNKKRSPKR